MTTLPGFPEGEHSYDQILARMLASLSSRYDKTEGSTLYDILAAAAIEMAMSAVWAQQALERGFAQTTFGEYLTLRAEEHGIIRRAATTATGTVTFTGIEGAKIPAGTIVSTASSETSAAILFETTSEVTILVGGTTVDSPISAVEAGVTGNVAAGTIVFMAESLSGISSVTNAAATTGGTDEETDASLLNRYLTRVRSPGTSGNKSDYLNWALEVDGVGAAQVVPIWNGPGTVKVILIGTDKTPAGASVVTAAQNYIAPDPSVGEGRAPIGADVAVVAATAVNINVSATIVLDGTKTLGEVQTAFENALAEYLASIAFTTDPSPKYVRIGSLLLDTPGVQDYSGLTVNGGTGNVTINTGEVAVKGTVTLT